MPDVYYELPAAMVEQLASSDYGVLLESSRVSDEEHTSYLFRDPVDLVTLEDPNELAAFFSELEAQQAKGRFVVGYMAYELGYALVGLPMYRVPAYPLAQFAAFDRATKFDHLTGTMSPGLLPVTPATDHAEVELTGLHSDVTEPAYLERFQRVRQYLEAGDSYQVNLTHAFDFTLAGAPAALYRRLKRSQSVSYGAFMKLPAVTVISLSPELFFKLEAKKLTARPMKGTCPRGVLPEDDERRMAELQGDVKSRAENVMIVDLLRNDLGRVCETGSVEVPRLFDVERYRTLHQMTSTVTGIRRDDVDLRQLFTALFPCGSVTGAPKRRSMEIIAELEPRPRGVYTGAIGMLKPGGDAIFNVAIRTLVVSSERGTMGVGSGIVHDSRPRQEYRECALKTRFLTAAEEPFELIETMRWSGGFRRLERHLNRLARSATYFGFAFSRERAEAALKRAETGFRQDASYRVRLRLGQDGSAEVDHRPLCAVEGETGELRVAISDLLVNSSDPFQYHKTTRRRLYDGESARARQLGLADFVFFNERAELCEGTISTVFVRRDGRQLTPPLSSGPLPGVLREHLLETRSDVSEEVLFREDLRHAEAIYLGSSLRGLRQVRLAQDVAQPVK